jgi:ABC-2 type transport system ATP-binding protein
MATAAAASDTVVIEQVEVAYGPTLALDGTGLRVASGDTLAVLGHNGAGKTSLIRVMTTAIRPDRGRVTIDGVDAIQHPAEVCRRIGVTGQYAGLDDFLTTSENLELVGRLVGLRGASRGRASDLVDRFELRDVADRRVGELSGGTRRRVDLADSLVGSPSVLFLDEPTTGLDPAARQTLWTVVQELTAFGTTAVLTTQYLEEVDRLADHVIVLDHGRIAAQGTPSELKNLIGGTLVRATIPAHRVRELPRPPDATEPVDHGRRRVSFTLPDAAAAAQLVGAVAASSIELTDLDVSSPSLDDVFFHLATAGAPT